MKTILCTARAKFAQPVDETVGSAGFDPSQPGELYGIQTGTVKAWQKKVVTYSLSSTTTDIASPYNQLVALNESIRNWGARINLKFQRVRVDQNPDCPVLFSKTDPYFFPGGQEDNTILAYSWTGDQEESGNRGLVIHDSPSILWSLDGLPMKCGDLLAQGRVKGCPFYDEQIPTYDIRNTITHEFGHTLGLEHPKPNECPTCIMNAYYNGNVTLSPLDISSIQSIYGARTLPQRIIDLFNQMILQRSEFKN